MVVDEEHADRLGPHAAQPSARGTPPRRAVPRAVARETRRLRDVPQGRSVAPDPEVVDLRLDRLSRLARRPPRPRAGSSGRPTRRCRPMPGASGVDLLAGGRDLDQTVVRSPFSASIRTRRASSAVAFDPWAKAQAKVSAPTSAGSAGRRDRAAADRRVAAVDVVRVGGPAGGRARDQRLDAGPRDAQLLGARRVAGALRVGDAPSGPRSRCRCRRGRSRQPRTISKSSNSGPQLLVGRRVAQRRVRAGGAVDQVEQRRPVVLASGRRSSSRRGSGRPRPCRVSGGYSSKV